MKGYSKLLVVIACLLGFFQANAQNVWQTLDTFPMPKRNAPASFTLDTDGDSIPDKGFIFGGWDVNLTDYADLWQFDPATNTWSQKADLPSFGRRGSTAFVLHNIAYIANGANGIGVPGHFNNEVWAYNVGTNSWAQKNNFSGGVRWGMSSFALNGSGYIVMGDSGSISYPDITNDVWQYNPVNDSWTAKGNFPGVRRRELSLSFTLDTDGDSIPDRAYFGYGQSNTSTSYNDFWEYNPTTDVGPPKPLYPAGPHDLYLCLSQSGTEGT